MIYRRIPNNYIQIVISNPSVKSSQIHSKIVDLEYKIELKVILLITEEDTLHNNHLLGHSPRHKTNLGSTQKWTEECLGGSDARAFSAEEHMEEL